MIHRSLNIPKSNSFFLFGARGVGKTTLIKRLFSSDECQLVNLLQQDVYAKLLAYPEELSRIISYSLKQGKWIVIDEIQKVPALLDLVHHHIEENGARFALTGSSARKLRRGASNLLAGRAFTFKLYPLHYTEVSADFSLDEALRWGTLPALLKFSTDLERSLFLQSYAETYLKEVIIAEQVVRNLPPFSRFLQVAAQMNSAIINYAAIAADANTNPSNIKNYFQILEDTLLGFFLEPFDSSARKRIRKSSKFYFIDCGIERVLSGQIDTFPAKSTFEYGRLFETFIINQIRAFLEYSHRQYRLSYLLTNQNLEIDLIVERAGEPTLLIEIKSASQIRDSKLVGLKRFAKDIKNSRPICLCQCPAPLLSDKVEILPWQEIFTIL